MDRLRSFLADLRRERIGPLEPPVSFTDSRGRQIGIRARRESDLEALVAMYLDFEPAHRAQGTPPLGESQIRDWVDGLRVGVHAVATDGKRTVGHVMIVPDGEGRHELAIFVHPSYQRAGIGSTLLAAGLGLADQEDVRRLWLSVEAGKRGLHELYRRAGFATTDPTGPAYRMTRTL